MGLTLILVVAVLVIFLMMGVHRYYRDVEREIAVEIVAPAVDGRTRMVMTHAGIPAGSFSPASRRTMIHPALATSDRLRSVTQL